MTGEKRAGWGAVVRGPDEVGRDARAHVWNPAAPRKSLLRNALDRILDPNARDLALPHAAVKLEVSKLLHKLPKDAWWVLHDVPIGNRGRTIDHLVVGRAGVFTLRTRNHPGSTVTVNGRGLWVDGQRTDYHPVAHAEGINVRTRLGEALAVKLPVRAVIVVVCKRLKVESAPHDVTILQRRDLLRWLNAQPAQLPLAAATAIARAAGKGATWVEPAGPTGPP